MKSYKEFVDDIYADYNGNHKNSSKPSNIVLGSMYDEYVRNYKKNMDDFNWTEKPVIGTVLINAQNDSNGNEINKDLLYFVAKHKETGQLLIIPTGENARENFMNEVLKRQNKFN